VKLWKDKRRKKNSKDKEKKRRLYYHILQIDEGDGFGFYDLDIDKDWGVLYKLKLEWMKEAPEFKYRIITQGTYRTWREVTNDENK
jgi:hypothetical protein